LSPRIWNPAVKLPDMLKYLTWTLGLSINLIGLKYNSTRYNDTFKCAHKRPCLLPYYKFQNTFARFNKESHKKFFQINILELSENNKNNKNNKNSNNNNNSNNNDNNNNNKKYYVISSTSCSPILINQQPNFDFHYESEPVTLHDINAILKQKPIEPKSFSITLYSTSSFVRSCHTKIITRSVVGHLPSNSDDKHNNLHLFLTPHLHDSTFDVQLLDLTSKNIEFNPKNVYCNTHITEGKYDLKNTQSGPNKTMLNQEHCICEHPDTKKYHAPTKKTFKPLGES
jgi:hypothetical protein